MAFKQFGSNQFDKWLVNLQGHHFLTIQRKIVCEMMDRIFEWRFVAMRENLSGKASDFKILQADDLQDAEVTLGKGYSIESVLLPYEWITRISYSNELREQFVRTLFEGPGIKAAEDND